MLGACIKKCHPLAEYSISIISGISLGLGLIYWDVPIILLSICIFASIMTHRDPLNNPMGPGMIFTYCFTASVLVGYISKIFVRYRKNRKVSNTIKSKYR